MTRYVIAAQLRWAAWKTTCREAVADRARDERGAITTEAVIITALLAIVALGFTLWLTDVIEVWADDIPESQQDDPGDFNPGGG